MLGAYIVFLGLTILFAYLFYNIHSMNSQRNKKIKTLEEIIREQEEEILFLKNKVVYLEVSRQKNQHNYEYVCNPSNTRIPPNTIQAVKYAMKHAHPDNGGDAEDFIKFQKCYEELTRK